MRRIPFALALTLFAAGCAVGEEAPEPSGAGPAAAEEKPAPRDLVLDLDAAQAIRLPAVEGDLQPKTFTTPDGRRGWVVRLPGGLPLATPAADKGRLFVGGGFGSHGFHALDLETGKEAWSITTSDDGPTAAVVEDDLVAFNTESCTVIVCRADTGELVWQEWLGDPLLSQPAIRDGRLYIAYPATGGGMNRGLPKNGPGRDGDTVVHAGSGSHRLLCADLRTGRHLWEHPIPAEIVTAPVVANGKVLATCFDGSSLSLDAVTGEADWIRQGSATSAPLMADGEIVISEREDVDGDGGGAKEGLRRLSRDGADMARSLLLPGDASHLVAGGGGGVGLAEEETMALDAAVGFADAPAAANLQASSATFGIQSVSRAFFYQGARASLGRGGVFNAQGAFLNGMTRGGGGGAGGTLWRVECRGEVLQGPVQAFSPPALGTENLYLAGSHGHVACLRQEDGGVRFLYTVGRPILSQPVLHRGWMVITTADGHVVGLETGLPDTDGWSAWGGGAAHDR